MTAPQRIVARIVPYAVTTCLSLLVVIPVLWGIMASLSTNRQITLDSLRFPDHLHFDNYSYAWTQGNVGGFVGNSLLISSAAALLIAVLATMVGYALGRLRFPGQRVVSTVILAAIIMPVFSYIIPLSRLMSDLGLTNSRIAVMLTTAATFLPVPTLLMRAFFQGLPEELSDAGRLEGANEWQVFLYLMVPLARPGILTALMFAFVWAWNDVLLPVVLLQSPDKFTIPYGIASLRPADFREDYVSVFAGSMISTIPMILIYVFLQRQFISGLTAGSTKG